MGIINKQSMIASNWILDIFPMDSDRFGFYKVVLRGTWKIKKPDKMLWYDGGVLSPRDYARFMDLIEWNAWKIDT